MCNRVMMSWRQFDGMHEASVEIPDPLGRSKGLRLAHVLMDEDRFVTVTLTEFHDDDHCTSVTWKGPLSWTEREMMEAINTPSRTDESVRVLLDVFALLRTAPASEVDA